MQKVGLFLNLFVPWMHKAGILLGTFRKIAKMREDDAPEARRKEEGRKEKIEGIKKSDRITEKLSVLCLLFSSC